MQARRKRNARWIGVGVVVGLLALVAWQVRNHWLRNHTTVEFADAGSGLVDQVELSFYPVVFATWELAPPTQLATLTLSGPDGFTTTLSADQILEERAIMTWRAPGRGIGSQVVNLGDEPLRAVLQDPVVTFGRVESASGVPLPSSGVRLTALAGSARGPSLEEQVPDGAGDVAFVKLAEETPFVTVRAEAEGFATTHVDWVVGKDTRQLLVMNPTESIRGRVVLGETGVEPGSLHIVALSLPAVQAAVAADGTFELHGVPMGKRPQLLVHGLPEGITHPETRSAPGARDVVLGLEAERSIAGIVLNLATGNFVAGADVWHDDGPRGSVRTMSDEQGMFVLPGASSSRILVHASVTLSRRVLVETDTIGNQVPKVEIVGLAGAADVLSGPDSVDSLEVLLR